MKLKIDKTSIGNLYVFILRVKDCMCHDKKLGNKLSNISSIIFFCSLFNLMLNPLAFSVQ